MTLVKEITACEVCGSSEVVDLLDLGDQPMCDDLVPIGSQMRPTSYPLRLVGCECCITVHQAVQVEKRALFPQTYHYRAALTSDVIIGMRDLVASILSHLGVIEGKTVLDIGCNDGSLLRIFKEAGADIAGIEPTGAADDAKRHVDWLYHGFFDSDAVDAYLATHLYPDIITFTNVFAHIEDLDNLLLNLKRMIGPNTKVVIENHYLGAVVDLAQFDTFYHEHPRTYSYRSFTYIARRLGLHIERCEFPSRYNGNIRVIIGSGPTAREPAIDESSLLAAIRNMRPRINSARSAIRARLEALVMQYGPLPAKAFPGRAAILVHAFGIDEHLIDATYERTGSAKIGNYVPGTLIEIRDEAEFFRDRLSSPVIVNLAWHIQGKSNGICASMDTMAKSYRYSDDSGTRRRLWALWTCCGPDIRE